MFKKFSVLLMGLPLVGAIAGPIAFFKLSDRGAAPASTTSNGAASNPNQPAAYLASGTFGIAAPAGSSAAAQSALASPAAPRSKLQVQDAGSVFNFEITPEWILARWPNALTGLAELQLEGYRVPLVTGTAQQDLAGSLTYYFDAKQKLQRITFIGVSGDPRPMVGLVANRFHMSRRLTNDPGLVVFEGVESSNRLASVIHIRLAPPGQAGETYRHFDIELSLERPEE